MAGLTQIGVPTAFHRRITCASSCCGWQISSRWNSSCATSRRPMRSAGHPRGNATPRPIVEYYYKDSRLNAPLVAEEHIVAFGWANQQDLDDIIALALRVNDFLSGVMMGVGIRLADFKTEVGRIWEGDFMRLIVADEISPDSCRLWDLRVPDRPEGAAPEPQPMNDVYTELARRLGVMPSNVTHTTKPTLIN